MAHSNTAGALGRLAAPCDAVSSALVLLLLRLVMGRAFFLVGQAAVVGPAIPLSVAGHSYSLILPAQVRAESLSAFTAPFATAPVGPAFIAYGFAYAEFLLPLCLVIGFGTRIAALILLIMTAVLDVYVDPDALWSAHVYWAAILLVLITRGGGAISFDRLIHYLYRA